MDYRSQHKLANLFTALSQRRLGGAPAQPDMGEYVTKSPNEGGAPAEISVDMPTIKCGETEPSQLHESGSSVQQKIIRRPRAPGCGF